MAGRRPTGTGSVYQRGDGRWVAQIENGFTPKGRRRYARRTAPTKTAAQVILKQMVADQAAGQTSIDPRTTVRTWAEEWIETKRRTIKPNSARTLESAIRRWVIPTIGRKRLSALTPADVAKVGRAVRDAGNSATHAHGVTVKLLSCLTDAARAGHHIPQPVLLAKAPHPGIPDRKAIPAVDAQQILQTATHRADWPPLPQKPDWHDDRARRIWTGERILRETDPSRWMATLLQGMRQGEALGLEWSRVDLDRDVLDVSWQLQRIDTDATIPDDMEIRRLESSHALVRPKTSAGRRLIPIVPWMAAALADWRERQTSGPHDLVWPRATGHPMSAADDLSAWKALQRVAGVSKPGGVPFVGHEGRHAVVSLLVSLGIPEPVIIAIVGHSSFASSMRYTHVDLTQARQALQQVADRLQITD
ncbi:hypothetical protein DUY81_13805 [Acidipropionibacterium acidipropionici]|uniref:Integrase n=1 Tax=Acidipropionibacterium acidipropionici TaxID=1748 RepID=A0AAC8YH61_9ACTN|nr:site-specific integrase [Acidipropionibacterium acidipropionici]AMS06494.1 hypothetical protein AXH35_14560 [Acidipropionibacterium acidipropionici]AOZ47941.1 hypothetical protein A8L58_16015 [Acidipropionibacterium acidipropionici]AZP38712.1 hypothetical protein DUY81_13805 [Acidipropionibacterium acidipropionici]